ncbi:type I restriction-modification system, S subunit [Moorella thermoacetica Y72]|uniref:Type I restriction-modification system, S subunit n=1 Tax=Moorella thermoacetica Y72 TaxID=1325331 RepID=A0A0S6UCB2_NEOTH|nr:restriction endonuclease subunit S [Moorella thermoacetica]GAF24976.1 type I restriction-modification system, S subunit [Moorella thermoacetica Y72]
MIRDLKPYPAYKDSGVEWLGQVPEHWEVLPGRTVFREINDRGHPDEQMLSVTITRGVLRQADLLADSSKKDSSNEDKSNYKLVQPGDLVYNKMRAWQGAVGVSAYRGIVSPAYIVQRLRSVENLPRYMHFLLRTPLFASEAERWSYGITSDQWSLRAEEFKCIYFSLPHLPEQTAIVRFLDYMDRRIRRYIRAKQKLIKLLEEYRQALIHQAVTGKIDVRTGQPYPAYKPSGVQWLGKVPAHWEVKPVKRHYAIQLGKMLQTRPNNPDDVEVPYLKAQHIQWFSVRTSDAPRMWASPRDIQQFGITAGDLLVCEGGEGGRCGIVKEIPEGFIIQNALHRVRPRNHCRNDYLQYVMSVIAATGWFEALNNKATIAHFTREKFGALYIPIPSPDEQTAIVRFLDAQTAKLDAAIAAARREIDLLREYRTRLIADVVTGKVDVREVATQLPEEPPEEEAELMDTEEIAEGEARDDDTAAEALSEEEVET